uniref:Tubulin domain-containing protein n=1 Tax=Syphacia muris TaxID=451379 RepID=A0A0N5A9A1_9BILA
MTVFVGAIVPRFRANLLYIDTAAVVIDELELSGLCIQLENCLQHRYQHITRPQFLNFGQFGSVTNGGYDKNDNAGYMCLGSPGLGTSTWCG